MTDRGGRAGAGPVTALVLSGAGARGAYEAGVLSSLLPRLLEEGDLTAVVGTSAGALNAALVAAHLRDGPERVAAELMAAWSDIEPGSVHRRPARSLAALAGWHLRHRPGTAAGLLDTHPLAPTLRRLAGDFAAGVGQPDHPLASLAVVASSYSRSKAVVFVDGRPPSRDAAGQGIEYRCTRLTIDHLLASSAFPMAFPSRWLPDPPAPDSSADPHPGGDWYLDGGVHLNTPLKPALDLGADRVMVIGGTPLTDIRTMAADQPPDILDGAGQLLHAVSAGTLRDDLRSLERTNRQVGGAGGGRTVEYCSVCPQADELSQICASIWGSQWYRWPAHLFGYRLLGPLTRQYQRPGQVLSYLCFDRRYLIKALELGRRDGEAVLAGAGGVIPWRS
jgi:NTE family protein